MSSALLVFAKEPAPGRVKTRLTPALNAADAAHLYEAFLEDQVARYARLPVDVRLYESGRVGDVVAIPDAVAHFAQRGRGLGERMLNAFADSFRAGYERLVIVGSDHPTLPTAFIELAFEMLEAPRSVVIGPAEDGGFYLLGMNDLRPALFSGMTYGHPGVLEETLERIGATGASLTLLPTWYDVDTPESLRRLVDELNVDPSSAPRTFVALRKLLAEYPWLDR